MDVKLLFESIKIEQCRYRGFAFSSNSSEELKDINDELLKYLAPVEEWSKPGLFTAPNIPISRMSFCDNVFRIKHPNGLLINYPEEWMFNWTELDKGVFWSQLSQTYGLNTIYVTIKGTPLNIKEISKYFKPHKLSDSKISVWTSKYE